MGEKKSGMIKKIYVFYQVCFVEGMEKCKDKKDLCFLLYGRDEIWEDWKYSLYKCIIMPIIHIV